MSVPADSPHCPPAKPAGRIPASDVEAVNSAFIRIPSKSLPKNVKINEVIPDRKRSHCAFCKACFQRCFAIEASLGRETVIGETGLFGFGGLSGQKLERVLASSDKQDISLRVAFVPDTRLAKAQHIVDYHDPDDCARVPRYLFQVASCHVGFQQGDFQLDDVEDIQWNDNKGSRGKSHLAQSLSDKEFRSFEAADLELLMAVGKDGTLLQRSHFLGNSADGEPDSATYGCRRMNGAKPCTFRIEVDGKKARSGRIT